MKKTKIRRVTKEMVEMVKHYADEDMTFAEVAVICGLGTSTVGKIINGNYDHLLEPSTPPLAQIILIK